MGVLEEKQEIQEKDSDKVLIEVLKLLKGAERKLQKLLKKKE